LKRKRSWAFQARGAAGAIVMCTCGVLAVLSPPWVADESWAGFSLDALAWITFLTGAAFRFWSTLYIGGRKTYTLISEGPYSMCRNPLYVGTFLIWLSAAIFLKSLTLAAGVGAGILFYMLLTIPAEERLLSSVLGQPYEDYCRRVPRLLPRLALFHTPPTLTVNTSGLLMECRRAARWIWAPMLAEIVIHLRAESWWPFLFQLP
jgi:protein-S-isoprenylcysteine O-methyltransferase Ste14